MCEGGVKMYPEGDPFWWRPNPGPEIHKCMPPQDPEADTWKGVTWSCYYCSKRWRSNGSAWYLVTRAFDMPEEDLEAPAAPPAAESIEVEHLQWMDELLAEVKAVMLERGAKYGPGNIAEFGELGVLVRLSDKLHRLRHSRDKDFADEASRDAWLDIIGYGLIGLAWADKKWPGSE
jgi:hypothetical protein